jgi:hypothetical protein
MSTTTYTQHTVSGPVQMRRMTPQGRRALPAELVKVKVEAMILPAAKAQAQAEADKYGMSLSAYIATAVSLFDMSKFSS